MMEPQPLKPESIADDPLRVYELVQVLVAAPDPTAGVLAIIRAVEQHNMHMFAQLLRELRREIVGALTPPEENW